MRKLFLISIAILLLFFFSGLGPKAFSDTKDYCSTKPKVDVDRKSFKTTITITSDLMGSFEFRLDTGEVAKILFGVPWRGEFGKVLAGNHILTVWDNTKNQMLCQLTVNVPNKGQGSMPGNNNTSPESPDSNSPNIPPPCSKPDKNGDCAEVDTAIGPISTNPQEFVKDIFGKVLGLAGGIALLLIIVSGYKYMISRGNPEATKAANEQLVSAIIGLLFIIFSFVVLQIIGVDILKIPGFTN